MLRPFLCWRVPCSPTNFPPEVLALIQGLGQCPLLHEARKIPLLHPTLSNPIGLLDISDFCDTYQMHVFLPH